MGRREPSRTIIGREKCARSRRDNLVRAMDERKLEWAHYVHAGSAAGQLADFFRIGDNTRPQFSEQRARPPLNEKPAHVPSASIRIDTRVRCPELVRNVLCGYDGYDLSTFNSPSRRSEITFRSLSHHFAHQVAESNAVFPAKLCACFGRVSQKNFDLCGPKIARVYPDQRAFCFFAEAALIFAGPLPFDRNPDFRKSQLHKFAHRMVSPVART